MTDQLQRSLLIVSSEHSFGELAVAHFERGGSAWRAQYAEDADRAFSLMESTRFDAIGMDFDMPGVEEPTLFTELEARAPEVARLVFAAPTSGPTEAPIPAAAVLSRIGPMSELEAFTERAYKLHRVLFDPRIQDLVAKIDDLPAMPATYWKLRKASGDPNCGMKDLADIIENDPVLGAKVLQLVNSAFFGLRQRVSSLHRAVTFLGASLLKALALASTVFTTFEKTPVKGFSLDGVQNFSIRVARLAQKLMDDRTSGEEAFTAALLQDIGQLILAIHFGADYAEVVQEAATEGSSLPELERERFGASHSDVGALLLRQWGIPFAIVECVAFHHEPSMVAAGPRRILAAGHAADALLGITTCGDPEDRLDVAFLEAAGFGEKLAQWRVEAAAA